MANAVISTVITTPQVINSGISIAITSNGGIVTDIEAIRAPLVDAVDVAVINAGIVSSGSRAIVVDGRSASIRNTGLIVAETEALELITANNTFGNHSIFNSGVIQAFGFDGDAILTNGLKELVNTGEITSADDDAIQINDTDFAVVETNRIFNSGLISAGNADTAIQAQADREVIENTGVIRSAGGVALSLGGADDAVRNAGQIFGDARLGGGDDTYDARPSGVVVGEVRGEGGDDRLSGGDTVDVLRGGEDNDILSGNGGRDRLFGDNGNDSVDGGDGDDTIDGGSGRDELQGGDGDDEIETGEGDDTAQGGRGDDAIFGRAGDDTLHGGADDDVLEGNGDDDTLRGGKGEDVLIGGRGSDTLTGGGLADVFVFDTLVGVDRVTDFGAGDDVLAFDASVFNVGGPIADAVAFGRRPGDADDRLVYHEKSGRLWYDLDGQGGEGKRLLARFDGSPEIDIDAFTLL